MSPRPGGEADKVGNRYEARWVVARLLEILAERIAWVKIEGVSDLGEGIEFTLGRSNGKRAAHQVKRQLGTANGWSLGELQRTGVLSAAKCQVAAGLSFSFVSMVPASWLRELSEQARGSDDAAEFQAGLNAGLQRELERLEAIWGGPEEAWRTLRGVHAICSDELQLESTNSALASVLIAGGDGAAAAAALRSIAESQLGVTLDAAALWKLLEDEYDLRAARLRDPATRDAVAKATARWRSSIVKELLRPPLERAETGELLAALRDGGKRVVLATGAAGAGKSAVLEQVAERLERERWQVLAFRLDRLEPFGSTLQLGRQLDLGMSPAAALADIDPERPALLVVDQLDAVSFASGRMPSSFEAIDELLREIAVFPKLRVLLGCRRFDVENDDRMRALLGDDGIAQSVAVGVLDDAAVDAALRAMSVEPASVAPAQRGLLRLPLHLVLLAAVADEPGALGFETTKDLFDRFWSRKQRDTARRRDRPVRFVEVVATAVEAMSDRQRLAIPVAAFDAKDLADDVAVLTSEHVLVSDGQQVAFFHEAFFDYAFARQWMTRSETVAAFLTEGDQELFRRAQVRQVLVHLRDEEPERFVAETLELLTRDDVRFHVKDVVLGLLRALRDPTPQELELLLRLLGSELPFEEQLWTVTRTPAWFARLDAAGEIAAWLDDASGRRTRALDAMRSVVSEQPARVARLLAPYAADPQFPRWLRDLALYAPLHDDVFFALIRDAVAAGQLDGAEHELWLPARELGERMPERACDLLTAYLVERPAAGAVDPARGQVVDLAGRDRSQHDLIRMAAAGAPRRFLESMLPYLLEMMARTAQGDQGRPPVVDRHFSYRWWKSEGDEVDVDQTDAALLAGAAGALRALAVDGGDAFDGFIERLRGDPHDAAQWLLYEALTAAGAREADLAADILLEGPHRLSSGYDGASHWTTRELLLAIGGDVSADRFARLEQAACALQPELRRGTKGQASFTLLSALDEARLSAGGRRRLGELRRRFGADQPPDPSPPFEGGSVSSPIPATAIEKMTDEQWLRAIGKHASGDRDRDDFLVGGADEVAAQLGEATKSDPDRFAQLALRLDATANPAYVEAILTGLGQATAPVAPRLAFDAVRHAAGLRHAELDRWLGWGLRKVLGSEVPDDVIELVLDRALHSEHPTEELWLVEAGDSGPSYGGDPVGFGINTARGGSARVLGDLLIHDETGRRTALVVPALPRLASDPSLAVRTCVAHVIGACLRHARAEAADAFELLVDTDDRLLATRPVEQLIVYLGRDDPERVGFAIERMLASTYENVREAGGRLAAYAGIDWQAEPLLEVAVVSDDAHVRKGAALVCANRLPLSTGPVAAEAVRAFLHDPDPGVRENVAAVAAALRGAALRPHAQLLRELVDSPTFGAAYTQLLLTLEQAPDSVDGIVFACARRFIELYRDEVGSIAYGAAADARRVGELLLRSYTTTGAVSRPVRREALGLLDELLLIGAYGIADLIGAAER